MSLRLRLTIEWILIGIAGTILVALASRSQLTSAFDNLFYDSLSSIHQPAADPKILLVNIDQVSLDAIGKWPWKRETHARLLDALQKGRPRSITVDILLSEKGDAADDAALARAIARGPSPVILPLHFDTPGDDGLAYNIVLPVADFMRAAGGVGHVNLVFDNDGKVRRAALCFDPEQMGRSWPHITELAYRGSQKTVSKAYNRVACGRSLLIPFAKRGTHSEISYNDVLMGNIPNGLIEGHDVIIGASAAGMGDSFPVPDSDGSLLAGSEIMANMLTAIRRDSFIQPVSTPYIIILSLLPMWLLLIGFLWWLPRTTLIASSALLVIVLGGSAAALSAQMWFPPGVALLAMLLIYPLWGWRRLQAMSDFMSGELQQLEIEGEMLPLKVPQAKAGDFVGRQSAALASAIDHMRDLRLLLTNTLSDLPDPMVATDVSGKVTLTSDLVVQRLGQSIMGLPLKSVLKSIVIPKDQAAIDEYLSKVAENEQDTTKNKEDEQAIFARFQTLGGNTFVMRQSKIETAAGALQGYIYYFADISALANAEIEREQVLQLLSHDMRAPQSAIIASLDGNIDAAARKRIESNAKLTMKLAQDFVDIARMTDSKFAGEELLLADLIRDVVDNFWPLASERAIHIEVTDNTDCSFVVGEADSLSRAFANLIDNAIKFSPDNSKIAIDLDRETVNDELRIFVKFADEGLGIDSDVFANLFQRFAASNQQSGRVKGTGLGLTYVQAAVKRHKGNITVTAREPTGTCFCIDLPEAPEV
jgi:CHASE2 domain-containing sensor protein/signal transduction histidine kinase